MPKAPGGASTPLFPLSYGFWSTGRSQGMSLSRPFVACNWIDWIFLLLGSLTLAAGIRSASGTSVAVPKGWLTIRLGHCPFRTFGPVPVR